MHPRGLRCDSFKYGPVEAVLLLDDRDACDEANRRGWSVLGTLGLLRAFAAAQPDGFDLPDALARLRNTNFRVTDAQVARVLRAAHRG